MRKARKLLFSLLCCAIVFGLTISMSPVAGVALADEPLAVSTNAATNVSTLCFGSGCYATLNGNLTSMGNASSVDVSFEYKSGDYFSETTPQTLTTLTTISTFSTTLTGLAPSTPYLFRAKAVGNSTVYGDYMTFTTGLPCGTETWGFGCSAASASQGAEAASYQQSNGIELAVLCGLVLPAIVVLAVIWIRRRRKGLTGKRGFHA